jgi:hypothetical protein
MRLATIGGHTAMAGPHGDWCRRGRTGAECGTSKEPAIMAPPGIAMLPTWSSVAVELENVNSPSSSRWPRRAVTVSSWTRHEGGMVSSAPSAGRPVSLSSASADSNGRSAQSAGSLHILQISRTSAPTPASPQVHNNIDNSEQGALQQRTGRHCQTCAGVPCAVVADDNGDVRRRTALWWAG